MSLNEYELYSLTFDNVVCGNASLVVWEERDRDDASTEKRSHVCEGRERRRTYMIFKSLVVSRMPSGMKAREASAP